MNFLTNFIDFLAFFDKRLKAIKKKNLTEAQKEDLRRMAHKIIERSFVRQIDCLKFMVENSEGEQKASYLSQKDTIEKMFEHYKKTKSCELPKLKTA